MPIIGAHVSAAGGYKNAIKRAEEIGAECIQIFGASPRSYWAKMPDKKDVEEYKSALKDSNIKAVFLHAAYLVNLASNDASIFKKSVKNLSDHLKIAEMLGAEGLIFHIGSGKEQPREQAMKKTISGIKEVLSAPSHKAGRQGGSAKLIMENTAGGGQSIGRSAEEIGELLKMIKSKRVSPLKSATGLVNVCIDTAHAFESGMISEYTPAGVKKFLDELDKYVGFKNIAAFHVNDSKTLAGSHHDRHENIGEGHIGLNGFKNLAKDKRMKDVPWILEVPGFEGEGPDKKNVEILKTLTP
ncbi:MAG: deoxyribonuclease IV [Patescibacteria group bacterium]|jgi:deoxyribonuclease-4